jgi:hypothetical protein
MWGTVCGFIPSDRVHPEVAAEIGDLDANVEKLHCGLCRRTMGQCQEGDLYILQRGRVVWLQWSVPVGEVGMD